MGGAVEPVLLSGSWVVRALPNGSGVAIDDTFIEDLLDSVSAGFNLHAGLEFPITDRVRIGAGSKVEVLGDLNYVEFRGGLLFIWGGLAQEEDR